MQNSCKINAIAFTWYPKSYVQSEERWHWAPGQIRLNRRTNWWPASVWITDRLVKSADGVRSSGEREIKKSCTSAYRTPLAKKTLNSWLRSFFLKILTNINKLEENVDKFSGTIFYFILRWSCLVWCGQRQAAQTRRYKRPRISRTFRPKLLSYSLTSNAKYSSYYH